MKQTYGFKSLVTENVGPSPRVARAPRKPAVVATLGLLVGTALFVGIALSGCQQKATAENSEVSAEPGAAERAESLSGHRVEVVVVERSRTSLSLTVPGEVQGYRDALLASPMGGYVERVSVKQGDRVHAGQPVASVDQALHGVRLARAEVELESAKRELSRAKTLVNTIPQAEIDVAEDRVRVAEASLKELTLNVSRAIVRSPFKGYVAKVDAEVGEVAAPGAPLMRVVQLQPIKVTVALSDRDVALTREGDAAKIQLDARTGVFTGKITSISRAADLKTRSFEATIEVDNADELLLPGMIASVTLETVERSPKTDGKPSKSGRQGEAAAAKPSNDTLVISQDWLVTRPEGIGVFIEQGGKAAWRPVELGEVVRKQVEIEKGLEPGDALIIVGHRELVDGDEVLVHRRGRCCVEGRASFK